MMKSALLKATFGILMVVLVGCGSGEGDNVGGDNSKLTAPEKFLQIGTGPMGSGWYPITTVMSDIYMDNFNGLNASQIEGGSTANLRSLDVGDIHIGMNYTSDYSEAIAGEGTFEEKLDTVAAVASLTPVYQTIAVLDKNNKINKIQDIEDKHIFLGPKNGGGAVAFWKMMKEYGIDEESVKNAGGKTSYGDYNDGAAMLVDNSVDVFLGGGAPSVLALQDIELTNKLRILPIDQDKLDKIEEKDYGISAGAIPAQSYIGMDEEVLTYTTVSMLTARTDLDEEYVYNLTKLFWENIDIFEEQIPERAAHFTKDTIFDGIDKTTLHPGAKKYYEEEGIFE
ncbi:TAXI family TRAP transporter solute-binding subunit [Jeotgalibacillus marinus]|uniref:TAXI family TRAP transporter solute-binding subunit n=1 Tax=Jeotgalibacillus marinus TaxID=86667 RepID=A0ABV3Q3Z2_9BACL